MRDSRSREVRFRESVPNLVGRLFRVMARVHNKALKPFEVSSVQAHVLVTLWIGGGMTVGELQRALNLKSSTLTGAVDRMERDKLLVRRSVPGDRRAFMLEPADWPEKKKYALMDALLEAESECFSALTAPERKELARLLAKSLNGMKEIEDDAP